MEELLALPVAIDLPTAARALGIGRNKAYELAAAGTFPVEVDRSGGQYQVFRPVLFAHLGLAPDAVAGRSEAARDEVVLPQDRCGCQSGDVAHALYEAVLAAARVLVERAAAPS